VRLGIWFTFVSTCVLAALAPRVGSAQHITIDGHLSPAQTLVGPNYTIGANLGRQVGSNLFHSFGQFGLATGETAAFNGRATISSVIGRVTGGNPSAIDGRIQSNISGANLYLINPNGIVFGPNATVNVSGSFHASTADYVRMSDGAKFQATNPDASTLSCAPPAAFGFMTASPAAITVNGSVLAANGSALGPGTLGLVAGQVSISGPTPTGAPRANLSAPAGTIQVTAVAGTGEVPVDPRNTSALTVTSFDRVAINGRSTLNADTPSGPGSGGSVFIRSGTLTVDFGTITANNAGSRPGGQLVLRADNQVTLSNRALVQASTSGPGAGGDVTVTAGNLTITPGATILAVTTGRGSGGNIAVNVRGLLSIDGTSSAIPTGIAAESVSPIFGPPSTGNAGNVTVNAGTLRLVTNGRIAADILNTAESAGKVTVNVAGKLSIDGTSQVFATTGITSESGFGAGNAGSVRVNAGSLAITNGGAISASTFGPGAGGDVAITVTDDVLITGRSGILAETFGSGGGGGVSVTAGRVRIASDGRIATDTQRAGSGNAGSVSLNVAGPLTIDGTAQTSFTGISSSSLSASNGNAGNVKISAGTLSIANSGAISTRTDGAGAGGTLAVEVGGDIALRSGAVITTNTAGVGDAGSVEVTARGPLTLSDPSTGIVASAASTATGSAGSVMVSAPQITVTSGGQIASTTAGTGFGGPVTVTTPGALVLDGMGIAPTQIAASATGSQSGAGGPVTVQANSLTVQGGAQIASTAGGRGKGGQVGVTIAGDVNLSGVSADGSTASGITASAQQGSSGQAGEVVLTAGGGIALSGGAQIASSSEGAGGGGSVQVAAQGPLRLSDPGTGIIAPAGSTVSANAGSVTVSASQITLSTGAEISSIMEGTGGVGSVSVMTPGALELDGEGIANTRIAASATGAQSGAGGVVMVHASSLSVAGGAQIASTAGGVGKGGDVEVGITGDVSLSGAAANGTASGISTETTAGSVGGAGQVILAAGGTLSVSGGAEISSSTAGQGNGGTVTVSSKGPLSVSGRGGILALASTTASGDAGSVTVTAPQITVASGAEIASTTAGTGAGGSVVVTTPGALVLDGMEIAPTQIAASATGLQSGPGGPVTVAANNLTVEGGARIASSTAGPGKGGNVDVTVISEIVSTDPGSQITAMSTRSGDAGSVTVWAGRLLVSNGAAISTEATTANGGNITLKVDDFLFLTNSKISASVNRETGNGGNVAIDPQVVILDHSEITAQAAEGQGGNIRINTGLYIASADSVVSATSALGISGTVEIIGPRVDLNGALVVLSSELRSAAQVLRNSCAAQSGLPRSSLVEGGRGGLPQDPDATLPALYIAGREVNPNPQTQADATEASSALRTMLHLTMRCG
jgi:filamentous hemagglutinin family protein